MRVVAEICGVEAAVAESLSPMGNLTITLEMVDDEELAYALVRSWFR